MSETATGSEPGSEFVSAEPTVSSQSTDSSSAFSDLSFGCVSCKREIATRIWLFLQERDRARLLAASQELQEDCQEYAVEELV